MCPRPIERKNSFKITTSYSPRSDIRDCLIVTSFNDQSPKTVQIQLVFSNIIVMASKQF